MHTAAPPTMSGHRLPSLYQTGDVCAAAHPQHGRVALPASRYRNDPYRSKVLVTPEAGFIAAEQGSADIVSVRPTAPPQMQYDKRQPARETHLRRSTSTLPALQSARQPRSLRDPRPTATRQAQPAESSEVADNPKNVRRLSHRQTRGTAAEMISQPQARGPSKIALVQFKRTMLSAIYDSVSFCDLKVGDTVIVEGDRGVHIATVARTNVRKSKSTPTLVKRLATDEDLRQHMHVKEEEATAMETCRSHARRLGLEDTMTIVDVEFQLDFQKLTVFFAPKDPRAFVDFRALQRALYQHFRCRIWIVDS